MSNNKPYYKHKYYLFKDIDTIKSGFQINNKVPKINKNFCCIIL